MLRTFLALNAPRLGVFRPLISNQLRIQNKSQENSFLSVLSRNRCREYSRNVEEKLLKDYSTYSCVPWDDVVQKLYGCSSNSESNSRIFNLCTKLGLSEMTMSYYSYLTKKQNSEIPLSCYYHILAVLNSNPEIYKRYHEHLEGIYDKIKPHLHNPLLLGKALKLYYKNKKYWNELKKEFHESRGESVTKGDDVSTIICGAFYHNEPELGWKYLDLENSCINSGVVESYLAHCVDMAEENQSVPSLINKLIEFCQESSQVIPHENFVKMFNNIAIELNRKTPFVWKAHGCEINQFSNCSHCKLKLQQLKMSAEDFDVLKTALLNDVIIKDNVYVKSTDIELKKFLKFLNKCSPYDIVIDGLNIYYKRNNKKALKLVYQFINQGKNVLIISRRHGKNQIYDLFMSNPKVQLFFTDNLSDDDVFLLYAALHGGVNTFVVTNDYLRGHSNLMKDDKLKRLFRRWQFSHQYIATTYSKIVPPMNHSIMPQITQMPNGTNEGYTWHFPVNNVSHLRFSNHNDLKWVCLQAVPVNVNS